MTDSSAAGEIARATAEIVKVYLDKLDGAPDDLSALVRGVRLALGGEDADTAPAANEVPAAGPGRDKAEAQAAPPPIAKPLIPPVPIGESITPEYLISLEDGKRYRSLKRHLNQKFGLSPDAYRAKWGLPADYPMVAPGYAQQRSQIALQIGLGRRGSESATADDIPPARRRGAKA